MYSHFTQLHQPFEQLLISTRNSLNAWQPPVAVDGDVIAPMPPSKRFDDLYSLRPPAMAAKMNTHWGSKGQIATFHWPQPNPLSIILEKFQVSKLQRKLWQNPNVICVLRSSSKSLSLQPQAPWCRGEPTEVSWVMNGVPESEWQERMESGEILDIQEDCRNISFNIQEEVFCRIMGSQSRIRKYDSYHLFLPKFQLSSSQEARRRLQT